MNMWKNGARCEEEDTNLITNTFRKMLQSTTPTHKSTTCPFS